MNLSYFNILLIKLLNMHKEIKKNKNEYAEKHTTNNLWPIFDYTILLTEEFILLSNRSDRMLIKPKRNKIPWALDMDLYGQDVLLWCAQSWCERQEREWQDKRWEKTGSALLKLLDLAKEWNTIEETRRFTGQTPSRWQWRQGKRTSAQQRFENRILSLSWLVCRCS